VTPYRKQSIPGRVCKPSSVSRLEGRDGDHLSGPAVTDRLSRESGKRPTRRSSHTQMALLQGCNAYPRCLIATRSFGCGSHPGRVRLNADRLLGLAGGGVYPADDVAAAAVRSYRTFSPLPAALILTTRRRPCSRSSLPATDDAAPRSTILKVSAASAVCFLWHFPWGCPRWPLATTVPWASQTRSLASRGPLPCSDFPPCLVRTRQSDRPTRPGIDYLSKNVFHSTTNDRLFPSTSEAFSYPHFNACTRCA
jgi:hypothetical protein